MLPSLQNIVPPHAPGFVLASWLVAGLRSAAALCERCRDTVCLTVLWGACLCYVRAEECRQVAMDSVWQSFTVLCINHCSDDLIENHRQWKCLHIHFNSNKLCFKGLHASVGEGWCVLGIKACKLTIAASRNIIINLKMSIICVFKMRGAGNVSAPYVVHIWSSTPTRNKMYQNGELYSTLMFVRIQTRFTTKRNTESAPSFRMNLIFVYKLKVRTQKAAARQVQESAPPSVYYLDFTALLRHSFHSCHTT